MALTPAVQISPLRAHLGLGPRRTTSYSLALDNPIFPTNPDSLPPIASVPPSFPPILIPSFPILTPHSLQLSLSPQRCNSLSDSSAFSTDFYSIMTSQYHRKQSSSPPKHSHTLHTPSQSPVSSPPLSHTHKSTASVNYPTTAAEIIELLRKKICFLSGGRAKEGQSLITFPAKDKHFEYNRDDLRRVIQYLASIPV